MPCPTLGHAGAPALGLKHHTATPQHPLPREGSAVPPGSAVGWIQGPWCSLSSVLLADGNEILVDGAEAGPLVGVILPAALHQLVHLLRALLGRVQPHTWGNRNGDTDHWPLTPTTPSGPYYRHSSTVLDLQLMVALRSHTQPRPLPCSTASRVCWLLRLA